MPLLITPQMKDHLEGPLTNLCTCMKISLVDGSGVSFYTTDHDKRVTFGGNVYKPTSGYTPSAQKSKIDLSVGNMTVLGIIDDANIKSEDLRAGRFDYSDIDIFMVNYLDPDFYGEIPLISGKIGEVKIFGDDLFSAEIRNLMQFFQQNTTVPYTVLCATTFGSDDECKIQKDPPVWLSSTVYDIDPKQLSPAVKSSVYNGRRFVLKASTGTHLSGLTEPVWNLTIGGDTVDNELTWETEDAITKNFTVTGVDVAAPDRIFATSLTDADAHFDLGIVRWSAGDNIHFKMDVKAYFNTNGQIELTEPMPSNIAIGDLGSVSTGCDKKWLTCKTRYKNGNNFRGAPYLTGVSTLIRGN